jgi:endonuclease/exonuclease/phosphatase family metal-dependent hydrolase
MNSALFQRRTLLSAFFFALAQLAHLAAAEPQAFTFCSYNLRNWLTMERFTGGSKAIAGKPEEEKDAVIRTLKEIQPDVLGVCEIGNQDDVTDLQARLKAAGIDLPHVERAHGGDPTRTLALLSRLPIVARNSRTDLSYTMRGKEAPFAMQRGILDAAVELKPGFVVHFVGVHLKSMRTIAEADQALMRRHEAVLLRRHLDATLAAEPEAKILSYGDFNEHRNEPAIPIIMGRKDAPNHMLELPLKDEHGLVWTHFWDAADSYSRLDYLFSSRALRPYLDLETARIHHRPDFLTASDHRPLVIRILTKE